MENSLGVLVNRDKIGNLMALIATKVTPLYHTKLLKMLYLIDEEAVKLHGVPVTWLDYYVWQFGPVAPEIFYAKDNNSIFSDYIEAEHTDFGNLIKPRCAFNDEKFSELEWDIIQKVIDKCKNMTSEEIVNLTHEPDTLWTITRNEHRLDFSSPVANISNIKLDMSRLADDEIKLDNFKGAKEMMYFRAPVKTTYI
ncbi:MAG: SocA family protein [Tannerellaceae bacterium]|jgi:uncharacterized phage-associated protein|nr:SocA family protein [Tannerellaceae bacterium]